MDRARVFAKSKRQWKTGKIEETGCEIICGAPMTLLVKGVDDDDDDDIQKELRLLDSCTGQRGLESINE